MTNNKNNKSIVFIGFMGVGKTTIAKLTATKLRRRFIDIDYEIEKEFKMPITEIFKQYGEETFRQKEKEFVLHYCQQKDLVISLGGGAFMQKEIQQACLVSAIVVYLDISWDTWIKRMPFLMETRPLLQTRSLEEIEVLFHERKKIYKDNHITVTTDDKRPEEIAQAVFHSLHAILK